MRRNRIRSVSLGERNAAETVKHLRHFQKRPPRARAPGPATFGVSTSYHRVMHVDCMCDSGDGAVDHVMERGAKRPRRAAASVAAASAAAVAGAEGWRLDHVALLTRSVEGTVAKLTQEGTIDGHVVGPIETFPAEGTRECYIGAASGKLLLMEAVGTRGPYARAWQSVALGCTMWRSQCLICSRRSPWVAGSSMRSAQNPSHEGLAGSSVAGSPHCSSSPKILEGANRAELPPRSLRGSVYLSPLSWRRQSIGLLRVACVRKLSAVRCT